MNVITAVCVCMPRKVVKQPAVRPTIIRTPPTERQRELAATAAAAAPVRLVQAKHKMITAET